jgi:hypothetical protein
MSRPEILRRCLDCGASFPSGSAFCPQCGVMTGSTSATTKESEPVNGSDTDPEPDSVATMEESAKHADRSLDATEGTAESSNAVEVAPAVTRPITTPEQPAKGTGRAKVTGTPPGGSRRNYERRSRPRTENSPHRTSVVLDESAYDPSLRFVVIAGVLFVIFLVILIMSKWIG